MEKQKKKTTEKKLRVGNKGVGIKNKFKTPLSLTAQKKVKIFLVIFPFFTRMLPSNHAFIFVSSEHQGTRPPPGTLW